MSRELQTGSTGVAVEAVPEREVSCLSLGLQTCATAVGCSSGAWAWKFLFAVLQSAVAVVLGLSREGSKEKPWSEWSRRFFSILPIQLLMFGNSTGFV